MKDLKENKKKKKNSKYIGFAIQSVIDFFPDSKIIVINNNSIDESLEIVSLFKNRIDIKILNVNNYTPGLSLNKAINQVETEYLLILSAHAQITKMNFENVKKELKDNVAVFGNQTPIYKGKKINKRYIWSHFGKNNVKNLFSEIENRYFLHNAFCFYTTRFISNNPFDESLPGKEDRYWAIDIVKGFSFIYLASLKLITFTLKMEQLGRIG